MLFGDSQARVDEFIKQELPSVPQTRDPRPEKQTMETVFTRLRNILRPRVADRRRPTPQCVLVGRGFRIAVCNSRGSALRRFEAATHLAISDFVSSVRLPVCTKYFVQPGRPFHGPADVRPLPVRDDGGDEERPVCLLPLHWVQGPPRQRLYPSRRTVSASVCHRRRDPDPRGDRRVPC